VIVDVHTHTPQFKEPVPADRIVINRAWRPDRAVQATVSWQDYLGAQRPAGMSIVFNIAWNPGEPYDHLAGRDAVDPAWYAGSGKGNLNDATATFVAAYPDRLIGFMSLHPFAADYLDEFERCRTGLGLRGVKLGANYQNFDPLDARALAIYARAERYGLPVLFHQGTSPVRMAPIRYAFPLVMDEIAMRYPDLKIVMAHLGHPWQVETAVVIRKHPNVYADISATFYRPFSFWEQMVKVTEWNVGHKVLFGTDFPITTVQESLDHLRAVNRIVEGTNLPRIPDDLIEAIIHRDSLSLLGLS
jgi:predicted TIM-barrel fold metal-dependent hydrolase